MSLERVLAFIKAQNWVFAKTYAEKAPHSYIVKEKLPEEQQQEFEWFVMYIRNNGKEMKFWGKPYMLLFVKDYHFWTMGAPLEETIILNRAKTSDYLITGDTIEAK